MERLTRGAAVCYRNFAALMLALVLLGLPDAIGAAEAGRVARVSAVRFSPDGKHLAIGFGEREGAGGLLVLDAQEHEVLHKLPEAKGLSSIAYSPDGKWLAYSVFGQSPRVVSTSDYRLHVRLPDDRRGPVCFSPDSRWLAMAHTSGSIPLYDVEKKQDTAKVLQGTGLVHPLAFSPDGKRLLSGGSGSGTLWDVESGEALHYFSHGNFLVSGGGFSPDGLQLVTGGWNGTVHVWSAVDGKLQGRFETLVDRLELSHPAGLMAIGGNEPDVKLFDLPLDDLSEDQQKKLAAIVAAWNSNDYAERERASQDALGLGLAAMSRLRELANSSPIAEVRVRARALEEQLGSRPRFTLQGHWSSVTAVAFSPDGQRLASGSQDGTLRIWNTKDGQELQVLTPSRLAEAAP